jgi:Zn-dependent protease
VAELQGRGRYSSPAWNVLEYLSLFAIVLLHEFGHALACRQVGGTANQIMLWPLGGVAYVNPPQRPGATLWSIAAGPLVNLALLPVLGVPDFGIPQLAVPPLFGLTQGWAQTMPNAYALIVGISAINLGLLVFNMLPFYPLDGGQILRSLLWFVLGRGRSLMVAAGLGLLGILAFFAVAVIAHSFWIIAISIFMAMNCWRGLRQAQALLRIARLPRRPGFACPSCHTAPPLGAYWGCSKCQQPFDTFQSGGVCPHCQAEYSKTMCLDCQEQRPMNEWVVGATSGVGVMNGGAPAR